MRFLHVLDALDADGQSAGALLALLRSMAEDAASPPSVHDVLGLSGGRLAASLEGCARRVTVASGHLDVAARILTGHYDVIHALDPDAASVVAALVASGSVSAFAYSAPDLHPDEGRGAVPADSETLAILASCDLALVTPDGSAGPGAGAIREWAAALQAAGTAALVRTGSASS
jgi:hypothetical protein